MKWEDAKHGHIITVCDRIADNATVLAGRVKWWAPFDTGVSRGRTDALMQEIGAGADMAAYLTGMYTREEFRDAMSNWSGGARSNALLSIVEPYAKPWHDDVSIGRARVYDAAWAHIAKALKDNA